MKTQKPCISVQILTTNWVCKTTGIEFADIKNSSYYYAPVIWAADTGVTSGLTPTQFGPNADCTRAQFVTFLWRLKGSEKATVSNPFTDLPKYKYYTDAVLWAVEKEITSGLTSTQFAPNATCTRGQVVTFIFRTGEWDVDQFRIPF